MWIAWNTLCDIHWKFRRSHRVTIAICFVRLGLQIRGHSNMSLWPMNRKLIEWLIVQKKSRLLVHCSPQHAFGYLPKKLAKLTEKHYGIANVRMMWIDFNCIFGLSRCNLLHHCCFLLSHHHQRISSDFVMCAGKVIILGQQDSYSSLGLKMSMACL